MTNVLFVSAENAMRSQLAEACLRHLGQGHFGAYSCGVPGSTASRVSPIALEVIDRAGMPLSRLFTKSWLHFTQSGGTPMHIVVTLDSGTAHTHPAWPWPSYTAHWEQPALLHPMTPVADRAHRANQALHSLRRRIELLVSLHSTGKLQPPDAGRAAGSTAAARRHGIPTD